MTQERENEGTEGDTSAGEKGRMELQGNKSQGWVIDWMLRLQKERDIEDFQHPIPESVWTIYQNRV